MSPKRHLSAVAVMHGACMRFAAPPCHASRLCLVPNCLSAHSLQGGRLNSVAVDIIFSSVKAKVGSLQTLRSVRLLLCASCCAARESAAVHSAWSAACLHTCQLAQMEPRWQQYAHIQHELDDAEAEQHRNTCSGAGNKFSGTEQAMQL